MPSTVIVAAKRTPVGSFNGALSTAPATRLGAVVIKAVVATPGIKPEDVDEVIMGQVIQAGVGQSPARQALIYAGLPPRTAALTVNKVCGSGLKAVMLADQAIRLGDAGVIVAGGMENMSQAPYALEKARTGYRMGNGEIVDLMIRDGLWDPYGNKHMGMIGEKCAAEYKISRAEQDRFSALSYQRAQQAIAAGFFKEEIAPVEITGRKGVVTVTQDEEPSKSDPLKIGELKPAFDKNGTITAANASKINDGAAALLLMSEEKAKSAGIKPLARIVAHAQASQDPEWFTTAPAVAIEKVLNKTKLSPKDIDLWEINEAFAVVALVNNAKLELNEGKVNVHGGSVALGHAIGSTGARILVTLVHALHRHKARRGVAALCIGGGEAVAVVVELI